MWGAALPQNLDSNSEPRGRRPWGRPYFLHEETHHSVPTGGAFAPFDAYQPAELLAPVDIGHDPNSAVYHGGEQLALGLSVGKICYSDDQYIRMAVCSRPILGRLLPRHAPPGPVHKPILNAKSAGHASNQTRYSSEKRI